jgi:DNA sulfur modification protein DndB
VTTESITNVPPGEAIRDHLIATKKIPAETRRRLATHVVETVARGKVEEYEQNGWVIDKELKTRVRMRKEKPHDLAFEGRVWAAFARLQFTHLNRDRAFKLQYGVAANQTQQIDVFAADDEVVLVIECKSTAKIRTEQFKREIEAIAGQRPGIMRRLREEYSQHKVKFILATNNFTLSTETRDRLAAEDIFHVSEDTVDYFLTLAEHLGSGREIPATRGAIRRAEDSQPRTYREEPRGLDRERVIRMTAHRAAYILHRNQANSELMPTYQRLIKKSRLKEGRFIR